MVWRWMVQALDLEKNATVVICNSCSEDVSVANIEEAGLKLVSAIFYQILFFTKW